jgi:hypothetical protein
MLALDAPTPNHLRRNLQPQPHTCLAVIPKSAGAFPAGLLFEFLGFPSNLIYLSPGFTIQHVSNTRPLPQIAGIPTFLSASTSSGTKVFLACSSCPSNHPTTRQTACSCMNPIAPRYLPLPTLSNRSTASFGSLAYPAAVH